MKIAHIVTLIDPKGSFGGPVRVALNQAKALIELGHEVTIYAGSSGFQETPTEVEGVPVKLYPAYKILPRGGFATLVSPTLRRAVRRDVKKYEAWHLHLARDFVMLPVATELLRKKARFVVQSHGMIVQSSRIAVKLIDRFVTLRILRAASSLFALTASEQQSLELLAGPDSHVARLINGVPDTDLRARITGPLEFLFLGRLQARKRPLEFARAALSMGRDFPDAVFTIAGPDEGQLAPLNALIAKHPDIKNVRIEPSVEPRSVLERMARASVFVLPSINEPFPMAVLEAMSIGLPVVITESCGLSDYVRDSKAGLVTGERETDLHAALSEILLQTVQINQMGLNALRLSATTFGMKSIATKLLDAYRS